MLAVGAVGVRARRSGGGRLGCELARKNDAAALLLEIQEGDPRVREFQVELEAHGGGWMGF